MLQLQQLGLHNSLLSMKERGKNEIICILLKSMMEYEQIIFFHSYEILFNPFNIFPLQETLLIHPHRTHSSYYHTLYPLSDRVCSDESSVISGKRWKENQ